MTAPDNQSRAEQLQQAVRLKKAAARSRTPDLPPRPANEAAHLGEMQRSLWLAHQVDPGSPAYNLTSAFRVQGSLDLEKLQKAFDAVVSRHRLLRSSFRVEGDTVLQVAHPHPAVGVETVEVGHGEGRDAAIDEARKPFDLEKGPLIRLRVVEEPQDRFLLLALHHILADERSLGFIWKELAEAYDGGRSDPDPRVQYDDYVHWRQRRNPAERRRDLDYWRRRLDPLPDDLRLPFETPSPGAATARGRLLTRPLSPAVRQAIRGLATAAGSTPFMVYAFAFRVLLHRYTPGQRVAFATPVSTRAHPATASMIGYFTNPVVVSVPVDETAPVESAIAGFSHDLREALSHASVSFHALTEELSPPRHRDRHPVFQAMFAYQETPPPPRLGSARLEPLTLDLGASKFDLTLFVTEGEDSLEVAVEFRADRFEDVWMQRLLGHYEALLEHLPEDPDRLTAEVSMLRPAEEEELRTWGRGADPGIAEGALLPRRILDQARHSPQAPAVTGNGVRQSYGELEDAARGIANELLSRGVTPGDRVGVFLDRSALMIAGLLGSHRAGAAYVPLDPSYPSARNRGVLEDARVSAVLTTSSLRGRLPAGPWTAIEVDRPADGLPPGAAPPDLEPDSPAYVLYTSGSTGRPKGVVVTHENLRASTEARFQAYETAPTRFLLIPSLAFDSSVAGVFWTLAAGGTLVIPTDDEARDPRRMAELVAEERVTGLLCVPSLYGQMLSAGADRMGGLEAAIVAGESCSSRLVEEHFRALPNARLFNEYGPTEATVWATVHEVTESDAARPVAIGRPIPGVRVDVLDALGRPVPAGIPGLAWIAGPTVARGYWRRPDLTEERFSDGAVTGTAERRYRTGDRVEWTPDGRLLFLGREDDQIKLRGFRIEPAEIEAALVEHPGIEEAAVVAPSSGAGTTLVAFVHAVGQVEDWRLNLAKRLPEHMIPSLLVTLPGLPRLPNGKIDRRQLQERGVDTEVRVEERARIPNTRELALVSLWEGLLDRSGIGLRDNFFELGGHSLLVVEMTLAIEGDFEVSLTAADVFENPTVEELARRIEHGGGSEAPPYQHLFPIQPSGRGTPFVVAIPHFFSGTFASHFRGERPVYGLRGVSLRSEGNRGRWRTMADLGEEMVEEIRRRFPDEAFVVAGYSFGASMAVEAVRVMEGRGIPVHRLYLIAPMPLDLFQLGPFRVQLDGLRKPVGELSASEALALFAKGNNPLTRRPWERAWRRLGVGSWRRLLCLVGRLRGLAGLPLTPRIVHADVRLERFRLHAQYRPGLVHTPTVVFNARETDTDAAATWRPHFKGPFTAVAIPDPHLGDGSVEAARQVILDHLSDLEKP